MSTYDFVIAGGGLAGLSLAHQLCGSALEGKSILILDSQVAGSGERTWSYWSDSRGAYDHLASETWARIRFRSTSFDASLPLDPYVYRMIRGEDFYEHVLGDLEARPNVEFVTKTVTSIESGPGEVATVHTETGEYRGSWVFDGRFDPEEYLASAGPHHKLMQHFLGWVIETDTPTFDPQVATLFDFATPQCGEMRFVYVLPFSETRALVEFTLFSEHLLEPGEYTAALETYITGELMVGDYAVTDTERGVIPMTDRPFPRVAGPRVLTIGTRGGRVKASTGYTFTRVQADTAAIVDSLERNGHPFDCAPDRPGFAALDTILLHIMSRRGELSEMVFTALFRRNPTSRILRFLDEQTSILETIRIMLTVPLVPFIRAWWQTRSLGRSR